MTVAVLQRLSVLSGAIARAFATKRWLNWAVVYGILIIFFLVTKLFALPYILNVNAATDERKSRIKAAGVFLGFLEDIIVITLLVIALILLELCTIICKRVLRHVANQKSRKIVGLLGQMLHFFLVFGLVALTLAPYAADMLLMRSREMRFTTDLIVTFLREKDQASALEIDPREIRLAKETIVGTVLIALFFSCVYVWWINLTYWLVTSPVVNPTKDETDHFDQLTPHPGFLPLSTSGDLESGAVKSKVAQSGTTADSEADGVAAVTPETTESEASSNEASAKPRSRISVFFHRRATIIVIALVVYVVFIAVTVAISHAVSPLVAAIALNASINELFRNVLHVSFQRGAGPSTIAKASYYLESDTEDYKLYRDDVLYRKTNGFKGDLAFDVDVDPSNLPNVLVIGIESHRHLDSLYLSKNTARAKNMQAANLTLTPQFDRWAKKGIAFNNMWSSWQTSRSLEAVLFGQIAYDSVTDSGTTNGRVDTELSGMPQYFKKQGYSTAFTCGSNVDYDQWSKFIPAHGFDSLLHEPDLKKIAEKDYNITDEMWGKDSRKFGWGIHDDLTYSILGDMILDDVKQQQQRVAKNKDKKPFFRTHYTISSHVPFESTPSWFRNLTLPDFSPLCEDAEEKQCDFIKRYATLRYFSDMELGKFLDRMDKEGVLKDTIVIVTGDHGISPEKGMSKMYDAQSDCQRVAAMLIAQGRLGEAAGTIFDDAAMQYDWLNTLMDIIGVPEGGFLQTSVGRSLKRSVEWGTRLVWANNPMKKLSVIRGHERYVFDKSTNDQGVYNTVEDPWEETDLLPSLPVEEAKWWRSLRPQGRTLNTYFKKRWDEKCLTAIDC